MKLQVRTQIQMHFLSGTSLQLDTFGHYGLHCFARNSKPPLALRWCKGTCPTLAQGHLPYAGARAVTQHYSMHEQPLAQLHSGALHDTKASSTSSLRNSLAGMVRGLQKSGSI